MDAPTNDGVSASESDSFVNVRQFLESWPADVLQLCTPTPESLTDATIAATMGVSEDLVEELAAVCR